MFADFVELPHPAEEGIHYCINRVQVNSFNKSINRLRIDIRFNNGMDEAYQFASAEELELAYNLLKGQ